MAPCAEAGNRSYLFAGDIFVSDTTVVIKNSLLLPDLLDLHERPGPITITSDVFGIVYKNGKPTSHPVRIPKSATFKICESP